MAEPPLDFGIIRRLFAYTRPHQRLRNLLLVLVVIRSTQLPVMAWLTARVISGPIADQDPSGIGLGVLGLLAWVSFTDFCLIYRSRLAFVLGESVVSDLRLQIYAHLLHLPMSFFKRTEVGRLISRIVLDVNTVRIGVRDVFFGSFVQCGSLLVTTTLMAYYDWPLFLVVLCMAPGLALVTRYFRKLSSVAFRERSERLARVTTSLAESVNGIREIQSFVRQEHNASSFALRLEESAHADMRAHRIASAFQPVLIFNGLVFLALLIVLGGHQVLGGTRLLGSAVELAPLIQFLFLSTEFFKAIPILGEQYNQALTAMAGAERVFRLLDTRPDWEDAADAQDFARIEGHVVLRNVSFEYEPGRPVLHGIDLVAAPGQSVALVGHTGSGKSTIGNLIAKLYLPSQGRIEIDGRDLMHMTGGSLHRQLACVTQENFLISGSVFENILMGRPEATRAQVLGAVDALGVTDIIQALPDGLETRVGERGVGLSIGQRQIVCFARAMLAEPRIIILDEATSSVDSVTEARVQEALIHLLTGRTSFVIAHRLSTIVHADQVLVIEQGRIIERGTHSELLQRRGTYWSMYREFIGYQEQVAESSWQPPDDHDARYPHP